MRVPFYIGYMKATRPLCAKAVTPINAIKTTIIGNIWNFLLLTYNSKISFIVLNRDILFTNDYRSMFLKIVIILSIICGSIKGQSAVI